MDSWSEFIAAGNIGEKIYPALTGSFNLRKRQWRAVLI